MIATLFMIWLWVNTAFAYNITMCVDVNVDYPLSSAGGDNWTDNAVHKAARGFHYIVYKPYPTIYTTGNLSEADGDAGCTTVVGPGATYELKIQPSAEIGHALMFQQTDIDDAVCACSSGCNGGDNLNRKWWAQGFKEGIAWWYAMITWNARSGGSGGDCDWLNNQLLDVDLDLTTDYGIGAHLPCWGDLDTTAPDYTDGEDWLDDLYTNNPTCAPAAR